MSITYSVAACYANGAGNSNVRRSTDSGVNWTTSTADASLAARSITSNSTGSFMAVASFGTNVYTSTDTGSTFTPSASGTNFWNVVSNGDGSFLVGYNSTKIYKSTDNGGVWTDLNNTTGSSWQSIDVSKTADVGGYYKIIAADQANIYTSIDSGASWSTVISIPSGISTNWYGVTCSADGTKMAACSYESTTGAIIYSSNGGGSWSLGNTSGTSGFFKSIASSNDGTILYCCQQNSGIWKSTDSGANWSFTSLNKFWNSIDCSTDGTFAAAVISGDFIYTYTNGGSWTEQTNSGSNSWTDVTIYNPNIKVTSITSNPSSITNLPVGGDRQLDVTVLPVDASNKVVTYTSSNTSIATVTATGLVTGVGVGGPINITISATDGSNVTRTVEVTVITGTTYLIAACVNDVSPYISKNTASGYTTGSGSTWLNYGNSYILTRIATSSNGKKLAACANSSSYIYTSSDSGVSWIQRTNSGSRNWIDIASSTDGTKLAACVQYGYIYTSTDSGASWTERQPDLGVQKGWGAITSSSDGTKLAACENGGYIWTSSDSGVSWTQQTNAGSRSWTSITSSSDGTKLAATGRNMYIYTSTNSGVTWTTNLDSSGSRSWTSITSSGDGLKLAGCVNGGLIYTSTDSGANWTQRSQTSPWSWSQISYSSDGGLLAVCAQPFDYIYVSRDDGATFTTQSLAPSKAWYAIAVSGPIVLVSSITSDPTSVPNLLIGRTQQLTVTVSPPNASNPAVTYTSSNTSIATVDTNGLIRGVAVGSATVTIAATDGSGVTTPVSVTVTVPVTSISSNPSSVPNLFVGSTQQLSVTVSPLNATNKDVTYTSNFPSIATVDTNGEVTGVAAGSATVTIAATDGSGVTTPVTVTVTVPVSTIASTPSSITNLFVGNTQQLTVTVSPPTATNKAVTYTSSNTSIATVSATGLVTSISPGSARIRIEATDGSGTFTNVDVQSAQFCFRGNTRVVMGDRSFKSIKDIERGEEVLIDKKTGVTKKVARVVSCFRDGSATQIPMHLIGNRRTIVSSSHHPFWISDSRRILAGDIEGVETIQISELLYTIQFEEEATYYVEGVKVDAISPDHRKIKLPKELYFDQTRYKENRMMKSEDDERRKKPTMTNKL